MYLTNSEGMQQEKFQAIVDGVYNVYPTTKLVFKLRRAFTYSWTDSFETCSVAATWNWSSEMAHLSSWLHVP